MVKNVFNQIGHTLSRRGGGITIILLPVYMKSAAASPLQVTRSNSAHPYAVSSTDAIHSESETLGASPDGVRREGDLGNIPYSESQSET